MCTLIGYFLSRACTWFICVWQLTTVQETRRLTRRPRLSCVSLSAARLIRTTPSGLCPQLQILPILRMLPTSPEQANKLATILHPLPNRHRPVFPHRTSRL